MSDRVTLQQLQENTDAFFERHWPDGRAWQGFSRRWEPWDMVGTMPNHDRQGCYALLSGEDVLYVGVGASLGGGSYEGHGLGKRSVNYCRVAKPGFSAADRPYAPKDKWAELGMTGMATLGFPSEYAYLAYGLEAFLIDVRKPPHNTNRPGAARRNPT